MSYWTHITACLSVDTCIAEPDMLETVTKYITKAPKITGSEGDASVFINLQEGHNMWTSYDCDHCKYKDTQREVIVDGKSFLECDAPSDDNCSAEYQTCIVISIQGDLRDRMKDQTEKEFKEFLKFIKKEYIIRDYSINIEGE